MSLDRDLISRHFGDLWAIHTRRFNDLLIECRRHFDGDMDQMLILSIIGERTFTPERARGLSYDDFLQGRRSPGLRRRINTQSIADCTGIPRETVRRKLRVLIDRGWVRRLEDGALEVSERAAADLANAQQATFDYFLAVGNALACLEKSAENEARSQRSGSRG
jgi:DNA-binding MarR family transcriptional regulator